MSLEAPKLILEYVKVAVWPVIVLIVLASFSADISSFIKNIKSVDTPVGSIKTAVSGTGKVQKDNSIPQTVELEGVSPEMWFDARTLNIPHSECLGAAEKALVGGDFSGGGINNGSTVYGYDRQYVGVFWCIESPNSVFIVVSGPSARVAEKRVSQLVRQFESIVL